MRFFPGRYVVIKIWLWLPAFIICSACEKPHASGDDSIKSDTEDGWAVLFDGKTTNGWRGINQKDFPTEGWKVEDGLLTVKASEGNGGDIITVDQYGNFVFEWEWKMLSKGGNSGIKYFVKEELSDGKHGIGLEYQILDDENFEWMKDGRMKPGDYRTLAALYEIYPVATKSPRPLGEWNQSRIVSKGKHVEHWLNGEMVLEFDRGSEDFRKRVQESKFADIDNFGEASEGHILIQDHGSDMAFRNIRISVLP